MQPNRVEERVSGDFSFIMRRYADCVTIHRLLLNTSGAGEEEIAYHELPAELRDLHKELCVAFDLFEQGLACRQPSPLAGVFQK